MTDNRELFTGTAPYYARYRKGYSPAFFEHLVKSFKLDKSSSRILDLGCGTGQITIPLAPFVEEAVGLDPEASMLEEGKRLAREKDISNITWIEEKAENISPTLGLFRLTTMGASFHWMEQDVVLKRVYEITENGGGITIVANTSSLHRNKGDEWKDVVKAVIANYLGEKRRAGSSFYIEPKDRFETVIARSQFKNLQTFKDNYVQSWDVESIIGYTYSTSYGARRLFGDKADKFESELKSELIKISPDGKFNENVTLEAYLAWKQ